MDAHNKTERLKELSRAHERIARMVENGVGFTVDRYLTIDTLNTELAKIDLKEDDLVLMVPPAQFKAAVEIVASDDGGFRITVFSSLFLGSVHGGDDLKCYLVQEPEESFRNLGTLLVKSGAIII